MNVFGIIGWKNSGKTGLMERLVADISARGFAVSTLKHAHHHFDVDQPGKDSYRHRSAGAHEVLLSSKNRWALMHELSGSEEPPLREQLRRLSPCDLVLIEGYKRDDHPKLEANRAATRQPLIAPDEQSVLAVASDQKHSDLTVPQFDLNDTKSIADFILNHVGLVAEDTISALPDLTPPAMRDDCFALPPGVNWMPVDKALDILRARLGPIAGQETLATDVVEGRILAAEVIAPRSNPPGANSAVDGYGFTHSATGEGPQILPLLDARAAAGAPFSGTVPAGKAIRILTGALLPDGVDTVVLEEDVTVENNHIAFQGPVKFCANARRAGEDVLAGDRAFAKGQIMRAPDLALLAGLGVVEVSVHRQLRVGVLSTGDELLAPDGGMSGPEKTYDANRPMLLSLARKWGFTPIDLGHVNDERSAVKLKFDQATSETDVILTSGGASAGDEDHVSALLKEHGALQAWRIALKPGRPLALGNWQGVPIFGLPGNPVAALVCALIFARPALFAMAGSDWTEPQGFMIPAAFQKTKKPGRREYLRARINSDGKAKVFASEGSGRISSLTWAQGLVELSDEAQEIRDGTLVRYLPYASFGI